ncbi:M48 family metallopeptidase [Microbulbifer pacificus]|uniref:M48 family metallopeptidase n=1 Tax=Microbulbifer pacificus TaxID=407164 RepID=A0AAU0N2X7_9GAMM|nr:M48 family metallopeptidase [Microbulbifer pacificus]WOX06857.1 M48 family metallopeptidase [Microbulbifer pacificus]
MEEEVYPAGPASIPETLTRPSRRYKINAWLAVFGLVLFLTAYLSLAMWFCMTAYRLTTAAFAPDGDIMWGLGTGVCAAILAVFMLKALFFTKRNEDDARVEVSETDEPVLFAFLNRLADDAGAPRPHKVYITPEVNAAVFYHLTFFNLLFPSKKNLEVGLGLVNVLNLSELKAVLAHEFGHFAQKSMAVGTWVYVAHQIAMHLIHQRNALDSFLDGLSRFDLRVAWVGWILKLIVWSIRSLLDTIFLLVVAAQRALSREMELQADLVAVSVTGSDALVHALHKLHAADEAWERSLSFAAKEAADGRAVGDMYAVQSRIIEHLGVILDDPGFGQIPPLPDQEREQHRVFTRAIASPPRMWSTHPENAAREENAKRHYIAGVIDDRSAWIVFANPENSRSTLSAQIYRKGELETVTTEQTLEKLDAQFNRAYLLPRFRGAYLGRTVVRHEESPEALCDTRAITGDLTEILKSLYPEDLSRNLDTLGNLREELEVLQGIQEGSLSLNGAVIRHRDRQLERHELPDAITELKTEILEAEQKIYLHDSLCRGAHRLAARQIGGDWEQQLAALLALLHYADHTEAELLDVHGMLRNVVAVITADGHVSSGELNRLMGAAKEAFKALAQVYDQAEQVDLGQLTATAMDAETWKSTLGEFELPAPSNDNINNWMRVIDSWLGSTANALATLKMATLEQLLETESRVTKHFLEGTSPDAAPRPPSVPENYTTRVTGTERKLQTRLDFWDRFQTATGLFPALLRFGVAASIIGTVIVAGYFTGGANISVYNGLATPVRVEVDKKVAHVAPYATSSLRLPHSGEIEVSAYDLSGTRIETFRADASQQFGRYVYNVAGASPLVQWTQVYGEGVDKPPLELGTPRWASTRADILFEEPPESVTISDYSRGTVRTVLDGFGGLNPFQQASMVEDQQQLSNMVSKHVEWDSPDSPTIALWLELARKVFDDDVIQDLNARLTHYPNDVFALRLQQDIARGSPEYAQVCTRHQQLAAAVRDDSNLHYIAARCSENDADADQKMLEGAERWPENPWFNMASGYVLAEHGQWFEATAAWKKVLQSSNAFDDWVSLDLARLLRLDNAEHPDLDQLVNKSEQLGFMLALEQNQAPEQLKAYTELSQGNLEAAKSASHAHKQPRVLRLIAASDGADNAIKSEALLLPALEGLDHDTVWLAWSQAVLAGQDPAPFEEWGKQEYRHGERALAFLRQIHQHGNTGRVSDELKGFGPRERGQLLAASLVLLQDKAPNEWREQVRALLFATERPYFDHSQKTSLPAG